MTQKGASVPNSEITLADIERQIAFLQRSIKELREVGIRLDEASAMSGHQARKWLTIRGATDKEATDLILAVVRERRLATSVTRPNAEAGR
jgi:hypothetical protein